MPSTSTPTGAEVVTRTGLNRYITGLSNDSALELWLESDIIPDAEAEAALAVGESVYDSANLSARQARGLAGAVCWRAAALALLSPALQKVTGTQEPLLMEDAGDITDLVDWLAAKARRLESAVVSGRETTPFALPAASSSTFTPTDSDRTPADKYALLDERDNISADDTVNG